MKKFYRKSAGFSLVELMIVVAIMAILAAIAIPSFIRFQMRAKSSESSNNLGAIRTCEVSYEAENDVYVACAGAPAAAVTSARRAWVPAGAGEIDFENIGFEPEGPVRYKYAVDSTDGSYFLSTATGDLDDDGKFVVYSMNTDHPLIYPKIEKNDTAARTAAGVSTAPADIDGF